MQVAATNLRRLLGYFGLHQASTKVGTLAQPPAIAYVAKLREVLIAVAKRNARISYVETLGFIGLPVTDKSRRQLYRQLNVLAVKQMILGEPQLCALVVLADKGIPGDGFYWVVDLPDSPTEESKRAAHERQLAQV